MQIYFGTKREGSKLVEEIVAMQSGWDLDL